MLNLIPDTALFPFYCIGEGWIQFRYKYDLDSLHAGGYIDIRYNDTSPWVSILQDQEPMYTIPDPIYPTGTLYGNIQPQVQRYGSTEHTQDGILIRTLRF